MARKTSSKRSKKSKGLPPNRPCGDMNTGGTLVQSLVFSKEKHAPGKGRWTKKKAEAWARDHGYRAGKVHETMGKRGGKNSGSFRVRQFDPGLCQYKSKPFGNSGITAVIETPQRAPAHVLREVNELLTDMSRRRR